MSTSETKDSVPRYLVVCRIAEGHQLVRSQEGQLVRLADHQSFVTALQAAHQEEIAKLKQNLDMFHQAIKTQGDLVLREREEAKADLARKDAEIAELKGAKYVEMQASEGGTESGAESSSGMGVMADRGLHEMRQSSDGWSLARTMAEVEKDRSNVSINAIAASRLKADVERLQADLATAVQELTEIHNTCGHYERTIWAVKEQITALRDGMRGIANARAAIVRPHEAIRTLADQLDAILATLKPTAP